ncbi:MAG: exodeoxyribonuclease VII large subunit, partial [Desulfuromonadales bacterium]|nr:exodeoxyribonuclease VII large subunit [Desulfuromonadales bacterium]NIS39547.1 exodeoxyribonuclease VII large subunit [Desulfuromonadales bacterium]
VPVLDETNRCLRRLTQGLVSSLRREIQDHRAHLRRLIERRFFREPLQILLPLQQRLDDWTLRLVRGLDQWVILQRQRLQGLVRHLFQVSPQKAMLQWEERRRMLQHRLLRQGVARLQWERKRLDGAAKNLNALSPLAILERGYSIATFKGKALKSARAVKPGDPVEVRLAKGRLDCRVLKKKME